jgi:hypothetical protein
LGKNASEADAEEIIEMASKASVADQQMVVQENVHSQIKSFCTIMDEALLPNEKIVSDDSFKLSQQTIVLPQHSECVTHQLTIVVKFFVLIFILFTCPLEIFGACYLVISYCSLSFNQVVGLSS